MISFKVVRAWMSLLIGGEQYIREKKKEEHVRKREREARRGRLGAEERGVRGESAGGLKSDSRRLPR